jgi:Phage stabilisation protein
VAGRPYAPFVGPSEPVGDRKASSQRAINLYMAEVEGGGEDKQYILESAPGITALVTMPGTIRGMIVARGVWYVVAEDKLYSVTSAGVYTERGTLITTEGYVSMKESRDQLVIVDGDNGYVLNFATLAFTQITDPDWRGSNWVEELDGYSVFVAPDGDQFYLSAIDDASTLDALDFSSADAGPDNIVTHRVMRRELLLMGSRTIETWVNSGDPDFPFTRYNSTPIDVGVVGQRAAINAADTLYWVGQTGRGSVYVYEMQGHQPVRISTQAVEESLATSSDIASCSMWTYQAEGAEFVGINAPGMATTWVFDVSTRKWHERCELVAGDYEASRVDMVVYLNGVTYASAGTKLYTMSRSIYTIDGSELPRERTWPHLVKPSMEPVAYRGVELACTTGHDGSEGFVTLEISNDGGYVYGAPLIKSLGAIGRRMQRIRWLMLGASRDRVFRVRVTSAVPVTFHGCSIDA